MWSKKGNNKSEKNRLKHDRRQGRNSPREQGSKMQLK
jgi:hypothetical protein